MTDPVSSSFDSIRSDLRGVVSPPILRPQAASLAQVAQSLDRSQWHAPELHAAAQRLQLGALAAHAVVHSPQFGRRLRDAGLKPEDLAQPGGLAALPLLTRTMLQGDPADIDCRTTPAGHGAIVRNVSSGSTGEPVAVRRTGVNALFWRAQTLRWHFWTGADPGGRFAAIRPSTQAVIDREDWGDPVATLFDTGPLRLFDVKVDYDVLAAGLAEFRPSVALAYPGVVSALLDRIERGGLALPSLSHVRLLGETVTDALRDRARPHFRMSSCYSTMELGYLSLECPDSGLHHVMAETALVEVLRADGTPAQPGESGRVVATDLHNFITPLVRYETGDWAEVASPCPCGRGLPTLARIHGRSRNMMTMPDGTTRWAFNCAIFYEGRQPLRQMQLVQHAHDRLEVRYNADTPFDDADLAALKAAVHGTTTPDFGLDIVFVAGRLDNPANGKFEEFVSHIV